MVTNSINDRMMNEMLNLLVYFMAYALAGFTLKLGDDLLDDLNSPDLAWYPLAASGLLFGLLMTSSEWDLVLLTAIIVGVVLSGKVNRREFSIGFLIIVVVILLRGVPTISGWLDWLSLLIMLFLAAVLDERGNDWADSSASPNAAKFFEFRLTLKISALLLVIPWPMFFLTAIGIWLFDLGYELAGRLSRSMLS
ncbi:MAG: hypothetical protein ACW97A_09260 [Candidatus Thorarchaeota archaeon]|jgi:hypothetical protein